MNTHLKSIHTLLILLPVITILKYLIFINYYVTFILNNINHAQRT